ncbi:MAG TPA: LysR family transcriptional regulator [Ferrovibrio sp.]|uniref:LysR family transcriptional regulator n=1 Tax=Ferrovibrio sp. TaxID=1917215 RepID=UPI002ED2D999
MEHLVDLAVFARVVENNSFSAAAAALKLSKSAVSKQVARLEARLGAQLLQRTTRKLALTETGRIVYGHAQRLLAEAEAAETAVQALYSTPRGRLRVNMPVNFGQMHVAPLLPDFLARCPELELELTVNDRRIDLLEEDVDVAIRIGVLADSTLTARRLARNRMVICAAPAYLRRAGVPMKPEDLRQHQCLVYSYLPAPEIWPLVNEAGAAAAVKVSGRLHANNGDMLRIAALAGTGIIFSPSFMVGADLAAGRLVPLLESYTPAPSGIYAVYPAQRYLTPKVRAFIDFLAERFGPEPPWDRVWLNTPGKQQRTGD